MRYGSHPFWPQAKLVYRPRENSPARAAYGDDEGTYTPTFARHSFEAKNPWSVRLDVHGRRLNGFGQDEEDPDIAAALDSTNYEPVEESFEASASVGSGGASVEGAIEFSVPTMDVPAPAGPDGTATPEQQHSFLDGLKSTMGPLYDDFVQKAEQAGLDALQDPIGTYNKLHAAGAELLAGNPLGAASILLGSGGEPIQLLSVEPVSVCPVLPPDWVQAGYAYDQNCVLTGIGQDGVRRPILSNEIRARINAALEHADPFSKVTWPKGGFMFRILPQKKTTAAVSSATLGIAAAAGLAALFLLRR